MYKKLDEKTIEAILESGIDVFVEKGLRGAGMNEIAKRSGVSVGVIYKFSCTASTTVWSCWTRCWRRRPEGRLTSANT